MLHTQWVSQPVWITLLFRIYSTPLCSIPTTRMTSIRGCGCPRKERTSEDPLGSSLSPGSSYDKAPIDPLAVGPFKLSIAKYTKEDLQKILRTVLETQTLPSNGPREKPLKVISPDVYCGKSHMECYNFCQQCEDHFATAKAKGANHIFFTTSFLHNCINFRWQQYKRKYEAESSVPIT